MGKSERIYRIYRILFDISILLKGLHALFEIIGGILVFFVSKSQIIYWVLMLTNEEFLEDPHDLLANFFIHTASNRSSNTQQFIGWYLLAHGIVKIIPIYGLLQRQLWAYPTAMIILSGFINYCATIIHILCGLLFFLSLMDLLFILWSMNTGIYADIYLFKFFPRLFLFVIRTGISIIF